MKEPTTKAQLLVCSGFWPTRSNSISGIFIVQQVGALNRAGVHVMVILPVTVGRAFSEFCSAVELGLDPSLVTLIKIRVFRLPENLSKLPGALLINIWVTGLALTKVVRRLAADNQISGCIVHGVRNLGFSLSSWAGLVTGKMVVVMHGRDPYFQPDSARRAGRRFFRKMAMSADAIVLVGTPLVKYSINLGIEQSKIEIVPNGTDIPAFSESMLLQRPVSEPRRIVSVSNLVALKGIQDNLHALSMISLTRPDIRWEYRIVGDGVARKELEELTENLCLAEQVAFVGRISYDETMREIEKSDIFSLPSWGEAFGVVYLEAMARMKPVIGCFGNGAADIVRSGVDGLLVRPKVISDLAYALESLLVNPELCREMGERAYATVQQFTWDANAERMLYILGLKSVRASK